MPIKELKPTRQCLLLAPLNAEFDRLFNYVRIAASNLDISVDVQRLDRPMEYGGLLSDAALHILRTIESADAVIVDLTGANPNVMYELGFAHALKKPVLPVIRRDDVNIPSDLQGYLYFAYDLANSNEFSRTVMRWLDKTFARTSE